MFGYGDTIIGPAVIWLALVVAGSAAGFVLLARLGYRVPTRLEWGGLVAAEVLADIGAAMILHYFTQWPIPACLVIAALISVAVGCGVIMERGRRIALAQQQRYRASDGLIILLWVSLGGAGLAVLSLLL